MSYTGSRVELVGEPSEGLGLSRSRRSCRKRVAGSSLEMVPDDAHNMMCQSVRDGTQVQPFWPCSLPYGSLKQRQSLLMFFLST